MYLRANVLSLAVSTALLFSSCAGSIISREFLSNGEHDFDFRHPNCIDEGTLPTKDGAVEIRTLGSGGVYIAWGADAILVGPYFSRAGSALTAQFGRIHFDRARIAEGMRTVNSARVRAIVLGHSHFDHIGDIPVIAGEYVPGVPIYTNASGKNLLAAYPSVAANTRSVEGIDDWIDIPGTFIRILPVPSAHAPQLCASSHWPCTYARCETAAPETRPWEYVALRTLCGGRPHAFVIDLLDANRAVRYRIYYNDTAAPGSVGAPSPTLRPTHRFDLAILCVASFDLVSGYPEWLLGELKPRHVLLSHFEDFIKRPYPQGWQFVPRLTDRKARAFMERVRDSTSGVADPRPPMNQVCGPSTDRWSMPVPDSLLIFPTIPTEDAQ